MNRHPNIEILFCCSGEGRIRCDTRSYLVRSGEMVVVNSQVAHSVETDTEITVVEYLNQQRCRHAQKLILEGESISAAAHLSGFENLSYFSRTYKRYIGYLPSETDIAPRLPVGPRS